MSAPWGIYLERDSVHACTQEYTREYTVVYTRVHTTPLGEGCVPVRLALRVRTLLGRRSPYLQWMHLG